MKISREETLTVGDLIRHIALGHERGLVVVNKDNKLIGVVTQGDILRAIWNGAELQSSIDECLNYNPITIMKGESNEKAIEIFLNTGALVIPVIDDKRNLLGILNVRELLK